MKGRWWRAGNGGGGERECVCEIEFAAAAKARMARLDDLVWMGWLQEVSVARSLTQCRAYGVLPSARDYASWCQYNM